MRRGSSAQIELPFMADDAGRAAMPGLSPEEWRAIGDWIGYEVSDWGRVRSFWGKGGATQGRRGLVETPKIIGGFVLTKGHHGVALYRPGSLKPQRFTVHRLVLEAFVGPCPPGMEACHNDGDPGNNQPNNLRWDTRTNNQRDKLRHGTHPQAILKETDIPAIWARLVAGDDNTAIARDFGVTATAICVIRTRKTWTHITSTLPGEPAVSPYDPRYRRPGAPVRNRLSSGPVTPKPPPPLPIYIPEEFHAGAGETWRIILGWDAYRVSNFGNVESRWERVLGGCRGEFRLGNWRPRVIYPDTLGYMVFWASDGKGLRRMLKVHRCVLLAFAGEPPDGMVACHIDEDKANNRAENLRWDTNSANVHDWMRARRVRQARLIRKDA